MIAAPEVGLRAVGTALAALSAGFAVYMFAYGDHRIHVNGMEYLAIFAQPRGAPRAVAPPPAQPGPMILPGLDMTETGSIKAASELAPAARPPRLVGARADKAWVLVDGAIHAVSVGDEIPRVGRIAQIVERDGEWTLVDDHDAPLLKLARGANGAAMFGRSMIFR